MEFYSSKLQLNLIILKQHSFCISYQPLLTREQEDGGGVYKSNAKFKLAIYLVPTLVAEGSFILPLLFRSLFTTVFTVVVFFHREKNLCHDTIPFPVEHALSLPPNFWRWNVILTRGQITRLKHVIT